MPSKGDQNVAAEALERDQTPALFKRHERGIEQASKWHGSTGSSMARM